MDNFDLYFIGFYKHDAVQHLEKGPFVSEEDVIKAMSDMPEIRSGRWVVCKTNLPFTVEKV